MKRTASVVLILCLMLSLLPFGMFGIAVSAENYSGTCGENLTWTFDTSSGVLTISGSGNMEDYDFNESKAPWYSYSDDIQSVVFEGNINSIGDCAFSMCTGLTSVVIPNTVTSIGDSAFLNCYKLVEVYNLSSLDIQKGSTGNGYIGYYAWHIYASLDEESKLFTDEEGYILYDNGSERYLIGYTGSETDLTLPADVNGNSYAINNYAFHGCSSLTNVVIPDSVTSIGKSAFHGCSSLTSIEIPDSVTRIGDVAFCGCSSLTSIEIPDSVAKIGDSAFLKCNNLTSIEIPNGVTRIGDWVFSECEGLTSITIPDSVTSIGFNAFFYCTGLTSIEIPNSVKIIGQAAFNGCTGLTSVTMCNSVTSIYSYAFKNCAALADVYYGGSEEDRNNISIDDYNGYLLNATWHYNSAGTPAPSYLLGDIDGDGKISARDYQLLKRAVLKTYNLDERQKLAGDIDGDGKISARDYQLLKRAVLGTYVIGK